MNKTNKTIVTLFLMLFLVGSVFAQGAVNGNKGIDIDPTTPIGRPIESNKNLVKLSLDPIRSSASVGQQISYQLTIKDLHPTPLCADQAIGDGDQREPAILCIVPEYKYVLETDSTDLNIDLTDGVTLAAGSSKTIKFTVSGENQGINSFLITAKEISNDSPSQARVKGVLLIGQTTPKNERQFFFGEGFAVSHVESIGHLVDLKILSNEEGELSGKFTMDQKPYKLKGTSNGNRVIFEVKNINTEEIEMEFSGKIKKFKNFDLLEGDLKNRNGRSLGLTAFSKNNIGYQEVAIDSVGEVRSTSTSINEVISITPSDNIRETATSDSAAYINSNEDVYITPVEVSQSKILAIIPNPWGKKILQIEINTGEESFKTTIKENSSKEIQGYIIKVGSLSNENNIEISIEKA